MPPYLNDLNKAQREAVSIIDGPLLVVAGAGTGKTKTLVYRIFHLIKNGIAPWNILAVTFTNKAAGEMRERVLQLLHTYGDGDTARAPMMKTFHSLGVFLLRQHYDRVGLSKNFIILDRDDSISVLKRAMKARDIDPKEWDPRRILGIISKSKGSTINAESFAAQQHRSDLATITAQIWTEYERIKKEEKGLDFDDLLLKSYELLAHNQDIREHYQKTWQYIHIDEYQDTNTLQYDLIRLLIGPDNNICVVGDSDQTIYTWRGASMRNILHFEKDFPGAKVVILDQNYRSTSTILDAAQQVIEKNKTRFAKTLTPTQAKGEPIHIYQALNETDEAGWIAKHIVTMAEGDILPNDIAILFRTNFQSRVLEEAMLYADIPYQVVGTKFFERKEVKDVLAYLRLSLERDSITDMGRVVNYPRRGLGKVAVAQIMSKQIEQLPIKARQSYQVFTNILDAIHIYAQAHPPSETMMYVIEHSGIKKDLEAGGTDDQERLENIKELVTYATRFDSAFPSSYEEGSSPLGEGGGVCIEQINLMMEQIALMADQDTLAHDTPQSASPERASQTAPLHRGAKENPSRVKLMTIHAAKGLEFDHIFICGLEQGLFPSDIGDTDNTRDDEEERRLMYVALTRAKKQLFLSYAQTRTIYGRTTFQTPSEFLDDIPQDHIILEGGANPFGGSPDDVVTEYLDW